MNNRQIIRNQIRQVEAFNQTYPIGTGVRYWAGLKVGEGKRSTTRSQAQLLGGHTAVVWVKGEAGCIALSHVLVLPKEVIPGVCRACGCTDDRACVVSGEPCHWIDDKHTRCSACFSAGILASKNGGRPH